ncbi:hypothetical protein Peur_051023 [Populus x canadensis]|jgi:hypothetical protein|uniref:Uncharacterized protein n=1 Tax=Populus deltoides TaxID=3696 RepID=A0A8T2YVY6_POPDE|nr:hypothetical protein H0E87_011092 [Populus deltoides]
MDSPDSLSNVRDDFEFEELEITEHDGALLRDLLQETKIEVGADGADIKESLEVKNDSEVRVDMQAFFEQNSTLLQEVEAMMEVNPAFPYEEITPWYVDDIAGMVEFGDIGDALQLSDEEFFYGSLWQD